MSPQASNAAHWANHSVYPSSRSLRMMLSGRICSSLIVCSSVIFVGACSKPHDRGAIQGVGVPAAIVAEKLDRQPPGFAGQGDTSQILFGDLHVHTTFSPDAFIMSAPLMGGSGLHPPADACDYARYCSSLDFWSINDHAEGITPRRWRETRESIRECNAIASDPENPDVVAFLGWEWSQVSTDPKLHYGHKNVIFLDTEDASVPRRPIAAPREQLAKAPIGRAAQFVMSMMDFDNREFYWGIQRYYDEVADTPICEAGVDTRDLPRDCREIAREPSELFTKLNQWGYDSIVIPHGNTWGMNTPATTSLDAQLNGTQHDPQRQILFEVYSGHGNAEEYRRWNASSKGEDGQLSCPEPSAGYLPCCWRAGQIIRERCDNAGINALECQQRAAVARQHFVDAGNSGHMTVPGQQVTDWLDCGNCRDCFNTPMDHRPGGSAQYALAITDFENRESPLNYRFGLIGSSDNHRGQGGAGYKQINRKFSTEVFGSNNPRMADRAGGDDREPVPYSVPFDPAGVGLVNLRNMERQNSFFLSGGLVATHSRGRQRTAIWDSLRRREVYATSGDRILLWFDLLKDGEEIPMGSEVSSSVVPRFRVAAVGAPRQKPGCPEHARRGLGAERLAQLCRGECFNPSDERHIIERIEVVRIRPQTYPGEAVENLIEDPWKVIHCEPDQAGCQAEFEDDSFPAEERQTLYYVRAIQEASNMINAANVRCEYNEEGDCIAVNPCYGDYRTPEDEDCLAPVEQRAWSSPIFIDYETRAAQQRQEVQQ